MSIILPLCKNLCGESVNLNGTDGPPSKEMSSKNSSTSTREKSQLMHLASGLAMQDRNRDGKASKKSDELEIGHGVGVSDGGGMTALALGGRSFWPMAKALAIPARRLISRRASGVRREARLWPPSAPFWTNQARVNSLGSGIR